MPPKGSKTTTGVKNLSEKQLRRMWSDLKPPALLERLRLLQPSQRWSASGSRLSARCPFHDDNTPSFHIYLDRGYAKCFGCDIFIWNPLELWARIKNTSWVDALTDLRQQFGLKFLSGSAGTQLKAWEKNQTLKKKIMAICHDELINAINHPHDIKYATAQAAVRYLIQVRQIPVDTIPTLAMLGVMPPLARLMERLDDEASRENERREAEATQTGARAEKYLSLAADAKNYMQAAAGWVGALVFRLDIAPDAIGRLKLRRPDTKDMSIINDEYEEELGFFGLGWSLYKPLLGASQKYVTGLYAVEGEFDALSPMARQVQTGGANFVVLSVGGTGGSSQLDSLRNFGFEEIYMVSDAPDKKGDKLIEDWLPHVKNLRARVFTGWSNFPGSGDPDEAVIKYGIQKFQETILDTKNPDVFQTPQDWVFEKAHPEIENVDEHDLRLRTEVAGNWGRLLKNHVECDAYAESCNKAFGIPTALLKREIVAREENEPAFIIRVAGVLGEIFYVIGQRALDNDRRLYLWHKERRKIIQVSLADDGSIERELGATLGTNWQLFNERIGVPAFLEVADSLKEGGKYLQKEDKNYRWYLRQALIVMAQGAPDFDTAEQMGQGIHVQRNAQGGPPTVYVVNGRDVYVGTYDAAEKIHWRQLDGPSHNNIIFDVGMRRPEKAWLPGVTSAADLDRASKLDGKALYDKLNKVLDAGWRFKNHAVSVNFLAAHLMAATVCNTFRRQAIVAFHADTRAGKSKLLMGLISGNDFPRAHVIAAAVGMPKFTAAGIKQFMHNKTRPLCLDEFEDDGSGDKKSRDIGDVLELLRGSVGENNESFQGSRHGEAVTYKTNFFVFLAAINKARRPQDANRIVTVYMERLDNRPDPVQILMQEFGYTFIEELKKDLAIALLPHIAKLQREYDAVETEYGKPGVKPTNVDTRIFEALYPALSVIRLIGIDHHKFVADFCDANKEVLSVGAAQTDSLALFDWLCQSPKLKARIGERGDRNDISLLQMLATPETRPEINVSGSGLYYDEPSETLVVNWTTAIQTVLSGHSRYGRETNVFNLRELANRAPHAMKPGELESSGILGRLRGYGLLGVPVSHLTAYRVSHIIRGMALPISVPAPAPATPSPAPVQEEPVRKVIDDGEFSV